MYHLNFCFSDASPDIDDVRKAFEAFGKVLSVKLRKNAKGEFNGTAFVEYAIHEDVMKALAATELRLEGSDIVRMKLLPVLASISES